MKKSKKSWLSAQSYLNWRTSQEKYDNVLTSDEAVPTAKSFVPFRYTIQTRKYKTCNFIVVNLKLKNVAIHFKQHIQVTKNLLTTIAPNLCKNEYDVPARATWI